jgi:osmotically-inducible protein OsmY
MKKSALITILVILAILIAGGSFYGGMSYAKNRATAAATAARASFSGTRGTRTGGGMGDNFISGDIISKDATSITLQLPNSGGSKIIFYSATTQIGKFTSGTANDLSTGVSVSVTGTTNSDGTVTAQNIQIRPAGQTRPGQQAPGQ